MKKLYKRFLSAILILTCALMCACGSKGLSSDQLDAALSNCEYTYGGMFTFTLGQLVNSGMSSYEITYLDYDAAIEAGYMDAPESGSTKDYNVYYAIISGDIIPNPDIPAYTVYEDKAVRAILVFDDDGNVTSTQTVYVSTYLDAVVLQLVSP